MPSRVNEQALIDRGAILTREDARIFQRMSRSMRKAYEFSDRVVDTDQMRKPKHEVIHGEKS